MSSRFEKFSEKARRVLSNAQLEAQRLNQDYIGTEHILLGIIIETTSTSNQILSNIGIDLENLKTILFFHGNAGSLGNRTYKLHHF